MIVNADRLSLVKREYVAEASDIGMPPGMWVHGFETVDGDENHVEYKLDELQKNPDGTVIYGVYKSRDKMRVVFVLND